MMPRRCEADLVWRAGRKIKNPRVVLLDCTLEYKKGESQTNVEISSEGDWEALLKAEEDWIKNTVDEVCVCVGVCVLCLHVLVCVGVSVCVDLFVSPFFVARVFSCFPVLPHYLSLSMSACLPPSLPPSRVSSCVSRGREKGSLTVSLPDLGRFWR